MGASGPMLKIDVHTHILPPEIPAFKSKFGYGGFIELKDCPGCRDKDMVSDDGKFFRRVGENTFDPLKRIEECDRDGVRVQVLSTVPVMFSYWIKPQDGLYVAKHLNDHIAEVIKAHPKRFVGLGTLPMQDTDLAIQEAQRCMKDLGFRGFQIGSNIIGMNLSEERFFPLYAELEKLGAALFIHPWDMMGQDKMQKYWLPWLVGMPAESSRAICSLIFGGVFEKFPRLKVAIAHGGGSFPMTWARVQHGFDVRPDLCAVDNPHPPSKYLGHFWVDSLVHDHKVLGHLKDLFGEKKICLGTDYPFPLGEEHPGRLIESSGFSSQDKEWMLSGAALEWLGLNRAQFTE